MKTAPPLNEGEEMAFDHTPSLPAFKRTALLLLLVTLPAVVIFLVVFPDTIWPAVPLFVTCLILMQERFTMGKHRAWVTNQRLIFQGGRETPLVDITDVRTRLGVVSLGTSGPRVRLYYAQEPETLKAAIEALIETTEAP